MDGLQRLHEHDRIQSLRQIARRTLRQSLRNGMGLHVPREHDHLGRADGRHEGPVDALPRDPTEGVEQDDVDVAERRQPAAGVDDDHSVAKRVKHADHASHHNLVVVDDGNA